MSQQVQETRPWVIISVYKDNTNSQELEKITPQIQNLVDEWQSKDKIMWSGAFNDNKTGMAIFEATNKDANELYQKYDKICSGILEYSMYQWDAMPILSILST